MLSHPPLTPLTDSQITELDALRAAIRQHAVEHPDREQTFPRGHRVISQGERSAECYLITQGAVRVLVRDLDSEEKEVALRIEGDLIGEIALVQRNNMRTASVEVASETATLIRLSRGDLFELLSRNPEHKGVVAVLRTLAAPRLLEMQQVLQGAIEVESEMMSALIADIHNFTWLGERVWEEHANNFLFDLLEAAEVLALRFHGLLEEQGDGIKVIFAEPDHALNAALFAVELRGVFFAQRAFWTLHESGFQNIGLGVGICSDLMSIRKRGEPGGRPRIFSHAISVAAAMAKHRLEPAEAEIYFDHETVSLVRGRLKFRSPEERTLAKTGRVHSLYRLEDSGQPPAVRIGLGDRAA